jgi:hypothetical protein
MKGKWVALLITWLMLSSPAYAQQDVGIITGTVRDSSGAVIAGAVMAARELATNVETETVSNGDGAYVFERMRTGTYNVKATMQGFKTTQIAGLRVIEGATQSLDFNLAVGMFAQTVTVTATALLIDTVSSMAGATRVNEEVNQLPLAVNGGSRNMMQWMRTFAGINLDFTAQYGSASASDQQQTQGAYMYGVRNYGSYNIDGVSAVGNYAETTRDDSAPIPDTIQEIRIATNLNAEYGQNQGSAMDFVTKSGTNKFHGSLFEYIRNDVFDARNFFAMQVAPYNQNEFGGVLGGPIVKNKVFFFGSYDGYRLATAATGVIETVPDALLRGGNFSEFLGTRSVGTDVLGRPVYAGEIYDPSTTRTVNGVLVRDPFPNNTINTPLSSISQALQTQLPLPTNSGLANNWSGQNAPSPVAVDKFTIKVDGDFGQNRFTVDVQHVPRNNSVSGSVFPTTISQTSRVLAWQPHIEINYTRILRPNLVFNIRGGWTVPYHTIGAVGLASATYGCTIGLKGTYGCGTPGVSIVDAVAQGFNTPGYGASLTFGGGGGSSSDVAGSVPIDADLSWVKGRHNAKFGGQFTDTQARYWVMPSGGGSMTFASSESGLPGFPATGEGYASFLLGLVDNATLSSPLSNQHTAESWGFFGQDSWRVTKKLTINYGLRWDLFEPIYETQNRMSGIDPTLPNPGAGGIPGALEFWGYGPGRNDRKYLWDWDLGNWGPRLGVAYALTPKTVIRTSAGINYTPQSADLINGFQMPEDGWTATINRVSPDAGVSPAFNWQNGFPGPLPTLPDLNPALDNGGGTYAFNPYLDRKPGRNLNLGFGGERALPGNISLRVEYVGLFGIPGRVYQYNINSLAPRYLALGGLLSADINSAAARAPDALFPNGVPIPYSGFTGSVETALLQWPQYPGGVIYGARTDSRTSYNSLVTEVHKRVGQGLTMMFAYTISKSLWNQEQLNRAQLPLSPHFPPLDEPQVYSLTYTYQLPFGPGKRFLEVTNPIAKQAVGNWSVAGWQSYYPKGYAISLPASYYTGQPLKTGVGCGSLEPGNPAKEFYLNDNALTAASAYQLGEVTQLPNVRTCGFAGENFSVNKDFPVRENIRVNFAGEFFNLFNRHSFYGINTQITNPAAFGTYSKATGGRSVQFHLRLAF